jgi:Leucine-rich repeat (LRR) protein
MEKLIAINSEGKIVEFKYDKKNGYYFNIAHENIVEIISIPNNVVDEVICNNNQLKSLPKLPNDLVNLWCYDNKLTSLPELPNNLKILTCLGNQLTYLPELPQSLKELVCFKNNIKQLPNLRNLQNLKWVSCDIQCFEPYMLKMKNVIFNFYC